MSSDANKNEEEIDVSDTDAAADADPSAEVDYEPEEELGSVASLQSKLKKLRTELKEAQKKRDEYLDGWQRAKADIINVRREAAESTTRSTAYAKEALIEDLLPAIDSFDMAMMGEGWKNVDPAWRVGVESIRSQLQSVLTHQGIESYGIAGETFDPNIHEAIQEEDGDGQPGIIVRVLRRGYRSRSRIIRPAQVVVRIG